MVWYFLYFLQLEYAIDFNFGLGPYSACLRHIEDAQRPHRACYVYMNYFTLSELVYRNR